MSKLPVICPSCESALLVSELSCTSCETKISGKFEIPAFLQLDHDEQEFVYQFIISGGSLKKMASKMKKSYPTVRNFLDDIIEKISQNESDE